MVEEDLATICKSVNEQRFDMIGHRDDCAGLHGPSWSGAGFPSAPERRTGTMSEMGDASSHAVDAHPPLARPGLVPA